MWLEITIYDDEGDALRAVILDAVLDSHPGPSWFRIALNEDDRDAGRGLLFLIPQWGVA